MLTSLAPHPLRMWRSRPPAPWRLGLMGSVTWDSRRRQRQCSIRTRSSTVVNATGGAPASCRMLIALATGHSFWRRLSAETLGTATKLDYGKKRTQDLTANLGRRLCRSATFPPPPCGTQGANGWLTLRPSKCLSQQELPRADLCLPADSFPFFFGSGGGGGVSGSGAVSDPRWIDAPTSGNRPVLRSES